MSTAQCPEKEAISAFHKPPNPSFGSRQSSHRSRTPWTRHPSNYDGLLTGAHSKSNICSPTTWLPTTWSPTT